VGNAKDRPRGIDELKNRSGKCEGSIGGIDGLKNRSGKCQGPAGGNRRVKEPEWEMGRIDGKGGVDGVKNRSGKWEGPAGGGGLHGVYNSPVHYARGPH